MKKILNLTTFCFLTITMFGQQFSNTETLDLDLNGITEIGLYNHRGDIKVTGTTSDKAVLKYTRKLKSASKNKLEEAKGEIIMKTMREGEDLIIFFEAPNMKFTIDADGHGYYRSPNWDDWNDRYQVDFEFEIELEIPKNMNLAVSNHHSGLEVSNVVGFVNARNHHKDVILENVGKNVHVKTHHGDIKVSHTANPTEDAYYKTHHGDIKVTYQKGLGAEVKLKTHHGSFFTDFDWNYGPMSASVDRNNKGTKYKIGKDTQVKIGRGGPQLDFKTHHGSIYLLDK